MLIKIIYTTISFLMPPASLPITSMFPTNAAIIKSAGSAIVSARKTDLPQVCQPVKKGKAIRKIWNTSVEPAGKPNCVFRLIRQSGPLSIMKNFYRRCSWQDMKYGREKIYLSGHLSRKISPI